VRKHEGRLLHHLHERRQGVLRDPAIVLRDAAVLPRTRLLLLRLLQQHALLLRLLLKPHRSLGERRVSARRFLKRLENRNSRTSPWPNRPGISCFACV
jgi:hypothetical protein